MAPHAEDLPSFTTPVPRKNMTQIEATTDTSGTSIPDPVLHTKPTTARFSYNDVLPHRQAAEAPLSKGVAPFSSAAMFMTSKARSKPKASHNYYDSHLSAEAKARKSSSLKGAMKYFTPETISLCGGLPSSEYFPFEELAFEVPVSPEFSRHSGKTKMLRGRKHDAAGGVSDYDLSIALNYGQSMGPPQLMRFLTEHTEIVHTPPYSDWEICLTQGSTRAVDIALRMFCERGDAVLFEEYAFSSAIETVLPMALKPVGIKMDSKGLCAKDLEYVMSNWTSGDCLSRTKYGGSARPRVLYTVPTGQNPTGATQDEQRRRDILAVCEKYDIFILEDEPYYFLQMDDYAPRRETQSNDTNGHSSSAADSTDLSGFIAALIPSYLSLSTSGNVMRMDSFSKILAPGTRTGWVTGPANLIERFVRASEVSAQNPSGFSMMALFKLLDEEWGHEGFLRWLQNLRSEYGHRRDGIVQACEEHLPRDYVTFEAPKAGMFHWLSVDGSKHKLWQERSKHLKTEAEKRALLVELEEQIFQTAAKKHVLIARGSWFRAEKDNSKEEKAITAGDVSQSVNGHTNGHITPEKIDTRIYFRMTFAAAPQDKIAEAVRRFGETLREEFSTA